MRRCPQIEVVCTEIIRPAHGMFDFDFQQFWSNGSDDIRRYFVLERENIAETALEPVCPDMRAGARVDQLAGDANRSGDLADTAFQHVANTEFAPDLLDVDGPALVGKTRIAGDDEQKLEARQRRDDVVDDAISKIVLLGIAAHVLERQYRNRGPVRQSEGR